MKTIPLTQGNFAIVDDDDYEELSRYRWYYAKVGYAARRIGSPGKIVYMHRVIMKTPEGMSTDHVNHNKLDNQKQNLRTCSRSENMRNQVLQMRNKTGFKGVDWVGGYAGWRARIKIFRKQHLVGRFQSKEEAARAYDQAAIRLHGEFALTNAAMGRLSV